MTAILYRPQCASQCGCSIPPAAVWLHFDMLALFINLCGVIQKQGINPCCTGLILGNVCIFCQFSKLRWCSMITSSNGNIFRVTGPLWGESTGHRCIPLTKASYAVVWCFLWCAPEQTAEKTVDMLVIWYANALIMTSLYRVVKIRPHGRQTN